MPYPDTKNTIDRLKDQINAHGKLSPEQLKKVNYKFRLEWNYNSNSMEGNTLTMDETRSVMVGNIDVRQKPYKDVAEMKGHDAVVTDILKIGKGELRLSEARIKQIHEDIIYEENEADKVKVGKWKKDNNYIYNYKGERYDFINADEVPEKMHDLLNRTNAAIDAIIANKKNAPHALDVAFNFHLEYVNIHPFYDGNGRTARIVTNLILISLGFPPFWINEKERSAYSAYLGDIQGYGGNPDLFNNYLAGLVLRSQQIVMDVIEGRDIEATDDLDKEIAIWKRQLEQKDELVIADDHLIIVLYYKSIRPLFYLFLDKISQFDDLFMIKTITDNFDPVYNAEPIDSPFENLEATFIRAEEISKTENGSMVLLQSGVSGFIRNLKLSVNFNDFKNNGLKTFSVNSYLSVRFDTYSYVINSANSGVNIIKPYPEPITEEEIKSIVNKSVAKLFEDIKASIKA